MWLESVRPFNRKFSSRLVYRISLFHFSIPDSITIKTEVETVCGWWYLEFSFMDLAKYRHHVLLQRHDRVQSISFSRFKPAPHAPILVMLHSTLPISSPQVPEPQKRIVYFFLETPTVRPRRPVVLECCPRTRSPQ